MSPGSMIRPVMQPSKGALRMVYERAVRAESSCFSSVITSALAASRVVMERSRASRLMAFASKSFLSRLKIASRVERAVRAAASLASRDEIVSLCSLSSSLASTSPFFTIRPSLTRTSTIRAVIRGAISAEIFGLMVPRKSAWAANSPHPALTVSTGVSAFSGGGTEASSAFFFFTTIIPPAMRRIRIITAIISRFCTKPSMLNFMIFAIPFIISRQISTSSPLSAYQVVQNNSCAKSKITK